VSTKIVSGLETKTIDQEQRDSCWLDLSFNEK